MNLVPVDDDPFAARAPNLVPVDHDPFAGGPQTLGPMAGVSRALEANLPFVDRAVAAAKTYLPTSLGGVSPTFSSLITGQGTDYASNLAAEKAKNAAFAEQNPWTNAVGGLAAYAPAALIPAGSASLLGRALAGGAVGGGLGTVQGASNSPDLTNLPETGKDVALGAGGGATLGVAAPSAARLIGGVFARGAIDPARQALVQALQNAGVKPTAGQITGNQGLQKLEASISDIPFGGGGAEPIRQANNAAFTKAILTKAGFPDVPDASPQSLNAAHEALGKQFDQLGGRNAIIPDDQFASDLRGAVNDYHNVTGTPAPGISKVVEGITGIPSNAEMPAAERAQLTDAQGPKVSSEANDGAQNEPRAAATVRAAVDAVLPDTFSIFGPDGKHLGIVRARLQGKNLNIDNMYSSNGEPLGANVIRAARDGLLDIFPEAETIGGKRVTGSRREAAPYVTMPINAASPPVARPKVPPGPAPTSMLDFLRPYGLQDEGGDLASMGFANKTGAAPKGAKKLIDKENGVPMDEGLRLAIEGGYMEPHEGVSDLINRLAEHPTYAQADQEAVAARAARDEFDLGGYEGELGNEEHYNNAPAPSAPIVPRAPRVILGEEYNNLRSQLGKTAQKLRFTDPAQAEAYRGVQDALDSAMERSIAAANPSDLGAFQAVRQKYKNLLPIEYAAGSAGADAANGMVSPQQMRTALATGGNRRSYARGIGDLAPLTNAGNAILTNFPQSGTAPRTMMAHALQAAGGLAGGLGGASGGVEGAGLGATAGALALPALAGRAIMSRPGQAILANALAKRLPASQAAPRALSRASMAAALAANADLQAQRNQSIAP